MAGNYSDGFVWEKVDCTHFTFLHWLNFFVFFVASNGNIAKPVGCRIPLGADVLCQV